ncbi:MAG: hypothetical protein HOV92_17650 [Streptomyces sp.]|nr:hypothetical protein [Streptomyces sp.]
MELTVDLRWALVIADQLTDPPEALDIPALEAAVARHASKNRADADNAWRAATLAATVAQLQPFACRNNEVAALYAYAFMTHAGEPLAVEASHLVGMLARVSATEISIDMLAAFLRNARTA